MLNYPTFKETKWVFKSKGKKIELNYNSFIHIYLVSCLYFLLPQFIIIPFIRPVFLRYINVSYL